MLTNNSTAIIVIPNEGQCEDHVWLKHRTFAMLLTGHYATAGALCNTDLGPILGPSYRVENSPSARCADPVGSLVPADLLLLDNNGENKKFPVGATASK